MLIWNIMLYKLNINIIWQILKKMKSLIFNVYTDVLLKI